jgi:biopolymer transport protein ExbD
VKKTSKSHHGSLNELNITPLLDLAFVLLVIFIITTPQLTNNLEMNLPSATPPPQLDKPPPPPRRIVVAETGRITYNSQEMDLALLRTTLTREKIEDPEMAIVVSGSSNTDYQYVVGVLDLLQQLDLTKIGLATATAP